VKFVFNFPFSTFNCLQSGKAQLQNTAIFSTTPGLGSDYRRILIAKLSFCKIWHNDRMGALFFYFSLTTTKSQKLHNVLF